MGMTRVERVAAAFSHKESDRIPKGELSISPGLANALLGTRYPDDYQHFERDRDVRNLLHIDLVNLGDWPFRTTGTDSNGRCLYRSVYGYEYTTIGMAKHLVKPAVTDISQAAGYPVPDIGMVSPSLIHKFRSETDFFIFGQIGGPVSMLGEMLGMEDHMVWCLTEQPAIATITERVMEHEIAKAKLFIDHGAHAILIADDIAFNTGLLLPPQAMQTLVYPFYKEAVKSIHAYAPVPVMFHSDGYLMDALDCLVECGFDGLQSLQPSAGMDIGLVKERYGSSLCLMGNIDLDRVLTFSAPEEVADTVAETLEKAASGGGFILSSCNTLIDAIPPDNVLAMYRTADAWPNISPHTKTEPREDLPW